MTRKLLWALLLIALTVIVLILNTGRQVPVGILPGVELRAIGSFVYLTFVIIGVAIGLLLK